MGRIQKKGVSRNDTYLITLARILSFCWSKDSKDCNEPLVRKNALAGDKDGREGDKRKIKWEDQLSDRKFDHQHPPNTIIHPFLLSSQSTAHRPIVQTV